MDPARRLSLTLDFCLRVGDLLLSSGAGAADVTITMTSLARALGAPNLDVDITFTSLSVTHQSRSDEAPVMARRQVVSRVIDYRDLTRVDHLVRSVLRGDVDLLEGRAELRRIVSADHDRPRWAITAGWGVMAAGIAVQLGGGWEVVLLAALAALTIDRLQLRVRRRRLPSFYQQVAGAGVATLIAVAAAATPLDANVSLVITANIVMLLAGIGFMGALQDALTGFYITAGARLTEALLSTAGIIAGVSGGLSLSFAFGVELPEMEPGETSFQSLGLLALGAAVGAAGFAFASYSPKRLLAPVAVLAALAVLVSRSLEETGLARSWTVAVAALIVGLSGYAVAARLRLPPLIVVVSAVVPLLPGISIYRGLALISEGSRQDTAMGLISLFTAGSVALALAAGVILGESLAQPLGREARRVEERLAVPRLAGARMAGPRLVGPVRSLSRRVQARQPGSRSSGSPPLGHAIRLASQRQPVFPSNGADPSVTAESTREQERSASSTTSEG